MEDVNSSVLTKGDDCMDLPPGFRFHPTDEEIITHYLTEKVLNSSFGARAIGEVDLNKCEPWDLPKKAKMGEKEWYFFCQRDRKYPTGMRTNRATDAGYWKATGKDKEIYKRKNYLVGMKKTLVFYRGRAPKGEKTNWVMHEYRLEGKFSYYDLPRTAKDDWVVCRVFHKSTGVKRVPIFSDQLRTNSFGEDIILDYSPLPPLLDIPPTHNFNTSKHDGDDNFNGTTTASSVLPMRSSDANQNFSYSTAMEDHQYHNQHDKKNFLPNTYTITNHQENISPSVTTVTNSSIQYHPQISLQNQAIFPFQGSPNSGYNLHKAMSNLIPNAGGFGDPDQAILKALQAATNDSTAYGLKRQCKVEQFSSNQPAMVSVSQETGVSTDVNTDISSVVSKQDNMENSRSYDDLEGPSSAGAVSNLDYLWNF